MDKTIFFVDDMDVILEILKVKFESFGYTDVHFFNSPECAIAAVAAGLVPDLIVSDFQMPEMTGLEMLGTISRMQPSIKAIIMTADICAVPKTDVLVVEKENIWKFARVLDLIIRKVLCSGRVGKRVVGSVYAVA